MTTIQAPGSAASPPTTPIDAGGRVIGYDLARALAILGMVLVHFALVMSGDHLGSGVLAHVVELLDGRAAATFVVLAGVGLTLRSRSATASGNDEAVAAARAVVVKRGLFLLAAGFLNLVVWPGDILRVYGVSLLVAACLLRSTDKLLLSLALAFVAGFIALLFPLDYSKNWEWGTMTYHNLWTAGGLLRNLFYDGFRSVFPWTGLVLFGMWLGRRDLRRPGACLRFFAVAIVVFLAAELVSRLLVHAATTRGQVDRDTAVFLFGTVSMPPLPLFLLSAAGIAVAVITASILVSERFPLALPVRAFVATGQLALTWYVLHIVVGLGTVDTMGLTENRPLSVAFATGAGFFVAAAILSLLWRSRFRHGPLEWVMRRAAG